MAAWVVNNLYHLRQAMEGHKDADGDSRSPTNAKEVEVWDTANEEL